MINNRTPITIAVATLTACVGYIIARNLTAKTFFEEAVDRNEPDIIKKGRRIIPTPESITKIYNDIDSKADVLEKSDHEVVEITSFDGLRLVGHLFDCHEPKRIVISMHGWRSRWARDFAVSHTYNLASGCIVIYPEQRGQGNSEGEKIGFGVTERFDCLEWVRYINERFGGELPIYLAGISMGATTVLMTAGLDLPETVHGIIADCGFTSPKKIWSHVSQYYFHIPYGTYDKQIKKLYRKYFDVNVCSDELSTVDIMKNNKIPVLFVHGTDDTFVPIEMTYENYKACSAPKRLFIVPGAEHGLSYLVDTEGYQRAVSEFFDEFD